MEKYHKDILTISQRLKQLMSQQERQSEASLFTLLRSSQTQLVHHQGGAEGHQAEV